MSGFPGGKSRTKGGCRRGGKQKKRWGQKEGMRGALNVKKKRSDRPAAEQIDPHSKSGLAGLSAAPNKFKPHENGGT